VSTSFKLDKDLVTRVAELATDLSAAAEAFRDAWNERTERWQEGDKGTATDAWIEGLEEVAESLENLESEPE